LESYPPVSSSARAITGARPPERDRRKRTFRNRNYFASKAVGEVMKNVMQAHPQSNLVVLCGHTHGGGEIKVLENLRVMTGETEYGKLRINRILEVA
jgi:hypothetical protein